MSGLLHAIVNKRRRHVAESKAEFYVAEEGFHVTVVGEAVLELLEATARSEVGADRREDVFDGCVINKRERQARDYMVNQVDLEFVEDGSNRGGAGVVDVKARIADAAELCGEFVVEFQADELTFRVHAFEQCASDTAIARAKFHDTARGFEIYRAQQILDQGLGARRNCAGSLDVFDELDGIAELKPCSHILNHSPISEPRNT